MENFQPQIPPRLELWEQVLNALRTAIVRGDLPAGTRLVETELSQTFGVSTGTVRDALRQLEYEGLVESIPRRGKVVVGMAEKDIHEVYELRTHLEVLAARLAVERADVVAVERLQVFIDEMRDMLARGEQRGVAEPDVAFHRELVRLADQRRLLSAWESLAPTTHTLLSVADSIYVDMPWAVDQHQKIVDALARRDADAIEELVRTHTATGERVIIAMLRGDGRTPAAAAGDDQFVSGQRSQVSS